MKSKLYLGDCLKVMPKKVADRSIDLILADLPYATTSNDWDFLILFIPLWKSYKRVLKPNGAVILTAAYPFTINLINSNREWFRYVWYWEKNTPVGFCNAHKQPLRCIEEVVVFYNKVPTYNPQGLRRISEVKSNTSGLARGIYGNRNSGKGNLRTKGSTYIQEFDGYPKQILRFSKDSGGSHGTQKPVALMEYLIRTYTNEGETVLDNCMGSGTTGVAAVRTGRNFIGIEKDADIYNQAIARIETAERTGLAISRANKPDGFFKP